VLLEISHCGICGSDLHFVLERIGRDFDSIVRTHAPDCALFDTEADVRTWLATPSGGNLWGRADDEGYMNGNFVGTAEQVVEKVQGFVDAGCREFVLWFRDYPSTERLGRFMAEVAPKIMS
jgi:alkanesulfonate monooxygenase SsuD/methylene tetrahydromethanopterin reductase-like flavin-dependent oxidoreductase (luciferase family)